MLTLLQKQTIVEALELIEDHAEAIRSACYGGHPEHDWACDDCKKPCNAEQDFLRHKACADRLRRQHLGVYLT